MKRNTGLFAGILTLALAATACLQEGDGEGKEEWKGTIRNACGPADGPAIALRIGPGGDTGCAGNPSLDTTYRMLLDMMQVDSLKVGMVLVDTGDCLQKCRATREFRLKIERLDPTAVSGSFESREVFYYHGGGPAAVRKGVFILGKCPRTDGMCG